VRVELISWQTVERLLMKIAATGSADRKYRSSRRCMACMRGNTDAVEELVLSRRCTWIQIWLKRCITLSTKMTLLWIWPFHIENVCFLIPVFNYLDFRNHAVNFVKSCNIYTNQMAIKVAISLINLNYLSCDNLYLGVSFWDTGYI